MQKGLSLSDLSLVALSYFVVSLLVELPTGSFADRYGRRRSLVASAVIAVIAPLIYVWAQDIWGCILAETVYAVSCGFYNGALDAWMKHELQCVDKDRTHLQTASAKGLQAIQISLAVGALAGGYLASLDMNLPWIIGSALNLAMLAAVLLLMRENYQPSIIKPDWREGLKTVTESTKLKFVCTLGFLQCLATAATTLYWPSFFALSLPDPKILGVLCFAFFALNFSGAKLAEKFFAKNDGRRQEREMVFSQLLMGTAIAISATLPLLFASVAFYVLHEGARGAFYVTRQTYLQAAITKENQRALIGSISSFAEQAGSIVAYLACILLLGYSSIASVWLASGALAVIVPAILYRRHKTLSGQC
jgi:MFS family permease